MGKTSDFDHFDDEDSFDWEPDWGQAFISSSRHAAWAAKVCRASLCHAGFSEETADNVSMHLYMRWLARFMET